MSAKTKTHLLIIAIYAIIALLTTLPVILSFTSAIAGSGGDPWQTIWRFEHKVSEISAALTTQELVPYLQNEFGGGGEPRLVNLSVWPWLPIHLIFGQPLTYNIVWLLSFILSGYFMFLLVSYLTKQSTTRPAITQQQILIGSFIAGLLYMLIPFRVAHSLGHFGAMQTQWLPLLVLLSFILIRRPSYLTATGLALLLTVQAWTEHHYLLWFAVFLIILAIAHRTDLKKKFITSSGLKPLFLVIAVSAVLIIPSYLPTFKLAFSEQNTLDLGYEQTIRFSADLFSFITPAINHPLWGNLTNTLFTNNYTGNPIEAAHFLGLIPVLLVLFFHQHIPKAQKKFWAWVAIIFFIISLGPRLHIFGRVTPIPLPYALFDNLPVFSSVRAVARASIFVSLSTSILVGWIATTQIKRPKIAALLALIIILEFLPLPFPVQSTNLSPVYQQVSELPGSAIVEIPAATNYTAASRALYASNTHGKKVIGNIALERALDTKELTAVRSLPALRQLLYLRTTHLLENRADFFNQPLPETLPDVMKYLDTQAILVHNDSLSDVQQSAVLKFLENDLQLAPQSFGDVTLYTLDPENYATDNIFIARDGNWSSVGYDPERDSVFGEIQDKANLTIYNTSGTDLPIVLHFDIAPESHSDISVSTSSQDANLLLSDNGHATIPITIPTGSLQLTFTNNNSAQAIIQNPYYELSQ